MLKTIYDSPLGPIFLFGEDVLMGLYFKTHRGTLPAGDNGESSLFRQTRRWLDRYFSGDIPDFLPPLQLEGSSFQKEVWQLLLRIPYGETRTYGELASELARRRGISRMSAQAVGGAVGRNPISIIVPCHRVIGADGSLTGYGGGLDRKAWLLDLEAGICRL